MTEIILALDLPGADEALRLLDRLPRLRWVKVGSILMTREGPPLVHTLTGRGLRVFLDLKWHDIPNTVAGAVSAASDLGVSMATIHTLGGREMMEAAARAAHPDLGLVGVTVLTSHDDTSYRTALGRDHADLNAEVTRLARTAMEAGLRGIVCSPREVARVQSVTGPEGWIVVPGIRRPGDPAGDQARTATPREAAQAGATHLVVGRPILQADDPAAALDSMLEGL
ncbi:MAG: orotidine-5'-phosphate decarboxylase [Gemmatimonadales bacterium]